MIERDYKTITTPVEKHEVVLKAWLTGGERRKIRNAYLEKIYLKMGENKPEGEKVSSADVLTKAENTAIETIIESIDGKKEKIIDTLLEMRDVDYNFVMNEIEKIIQNQDFLKFMTTQESGIGSEN